LRTGQRAVDSRILQPACPCHLDGFGRDLHERSTGKSPSQGAAYRACLSRVVGVSHYPRVLLATD